MRKYIVHHEEDGFRYTNGFIIANHYNHSFAAFKAMRDEAKATFREIPDTKIECHTVLNSGWCKGCPIIRFSLPAGTEMKGWATVHDRIPDFLL